MNKKFLSAILFGAMLATTTSTFVSCKDYDDDINGLQEQVDSNKSALESQISNLQTALNAAQATADAATTAADAAKKAADNAQNAADKAAADIVAAQAAAQAAVAQAKAEAIAAAKADAQALLADYAKTADVEAAISELAGQIEGIEAGLSTLKAYDEDIKSIAQLKSDLATQAAAVEKLQDAIGDNNLSDILDDIAELQTKVEAAATAADLNKVKTDLGTVINQISEINAALTTIHTLIDNITSLTFIPTKDNDTQCGLQLINFYSVEVLNDEQEWVSVGSSNTKALYRVNPSNVDQTEYTWEFVNRVISRATGDKTDLISIAKGEADGDARLFTLNLNRNAYSEDVAANIITLKATSEEGHSVYSDYVAVKYSPLNEFELVRLDADGKETDGYLYNDVPAIKDKCDTVLVYNGELDLKPITELWVKDQKALAEYDIDGITYEFTLPDEYNADDTQETNQQWFVQLSDDGVLEANETNLTESLIPAIGRTPIVKAEGKVNGEVVATAYIKVEIVEEIVETPEIDDLKDIIVEMGAAQEYEYHSLKSDFAEQVVLNMGWEDINNKIYGKSGLTSTQFWTKYGNSDNEYTIKLTTTDKDNKTVTLIEQTCSAETNNEVAKQGFKAEVGPFAEAQTTSTIKASINNSIKTENTYKDIDGKGAEYTLTITIPSNNKKEYADFVLVQKVYVKEDCTAYTYNPLYYFDAFAPANAENCIVVKGQLNEEDTWEMSSVVSEHFAKLEEGNIWAYYNKVNNVASLSFSWAAGTEGVNPTGVQDADFTVALSEAMTEAYEVKNMTYQTTLVNGETCNFNYNIVFVNPFKAGATQEVNVYGNGIGENKGQVAPQVTVLDTENDVIYSWDVETGALTLSEKASGDYKVDTPVVKYAFDEENADYQELIQNMSAGSTLSVDENSGVFTWKNEGSTLKKDYVLPVVATVTFENLSEVKCVINVRLTANK